VAVTLIHFALLVVAAAQSDVDRRFSLLRSRPLITLGVWSFAFYLAHFPVMTALAYAMKGELNASATIFAGVVSLVGTLVAAALLHIWVERPLELRLRGSRPPARSAARQRMTAVGAVPEPA
jgi:peptidoglycan/LPS O-acetylase OafA/YrhL